MAIVSLFDFLAQYSNCLLKRIVWCRAAATCLNAQAFENTIFDTVLDLPSGTSRGPQALYKILVAKALVKSGEDDLLNPCS